MSNLIRRADVLIALDKERGEIEKVMSECIAMGHFSSKLIVEAAKNRLEKDMEIVRQLPPAHVDGISRESMLELITGLVDEMENSRDRFYVRECLKDILRFPSV